MALYSYKGNVPTVLPNRIKLADGFTKTDKTTFTAEEILEAGYVEVEDKPTADFPNSVVWNGETLSWEIKEPTANQISTQKDIIRDECKKRLADSDYKVLKAYEAGVPVNSDVVAYRQALRDLYNTVETLDPYNITWPALIIDDGTDPASMDI